jgi:hypothetical protein
MPRRLQISGRRFGRLTAMEPQGLDRHGKVRWLFFCDCGRETLSVASAVKSGKTQSCGCIANERRAENSRANRRKIAESKTKHGRTGTAEYNIWKSIKQRCLNAKAADYAAYGGAGISICDQWHSFESFFADMGPRPSARHSVDRINNSLGYSPENCRWATPSVQRMNQRRMTNGPLHCVSA